MITTSKIQSGLSKVRGCVLIAVALAGVIFQTPSSTHASIIAGPIVSPVNGHSYYYTSVLTWPEAEAEALALGGHLATIRNAAENQWLVEQSLPLTNRDQMHIGLNDIAQEGNWVWVSGEPVTYTNWGLNEPNNFGNEDFGQLVIRAFNFVEAGDWNDYWAQNNGIIEVIPEPTTLSLLGVILLMVIKPFRRTRAA